VYDYVKNKLAEKGLLKLDVKKSTVDSLVANMTLGFIQPHTTQPTSTLSEEEQQQLELQRKAKEKEEVEEESVEGSPKRHRSS
jgi:hypothetical protein